MTGTLICDEDGLYDARNFNDRLLLGMKGQMSEAELHFIRARLRGGIVSKARRGELITPLPVGLAYDPAGHVILDPDTAVRKAVAHLFATFAATGSASACVKAFNAAGLSFPWRHRMGPRCHGDQPGRITGRYPDNDPVLPVAGDPCGDPVECSTADHGRLKARLRPMRGLHRHRSARTLAARACLRPEPPPRPLRTRHRRSRPPPDPHSIRSAHDAHLTDGHSHQRVMSCALIGQCNAAPGECFASLDDAAGVAGVAEVGQRRGGLPELDRLGQPGHRRGSPRSRRLPSAC